VQILPGVARDDIIYQLADPQDLSRLNIEIDRLPLRTTERLMHQDARVR
jgi:hypothetical protein